VKTSKADGYRKILVPTDFSSCSDAAIVHAKRLAARFGSSVRFVHVLHQMAPYLEGLEGPVVVEAVNQVHEELEKQAKHKLAHLVKGCPGSDHTIRTGHPSSEIVKESESYKADLLVMGTHGRTGLDRVLLGSVTHQVMHKSKIPVLIVKEK
jgi:nucleotide-binding universal stress UspA family protein